MKKRRVCFATFELAPFTGGGIGTWLANTLDAYKDRPIQFEVLFCASRTPDPEAFARTYPGVVLHGIELDDPDQELLQGRALRRSDMASIAQWRSYLLMCALERLERTTGRFDVVEFVDWCGAAYFSLNAKRLGRSFQETVLSVRLHATESVLRDYETRGWSAENLIIADLERQALLDADVKVAHLATVADAFQQHFGFSDAWRSGFHIETPPVVVGRTADRPHQPGPGTPIVFTSKIQSIKRPEIFARATSRFLSERPDYQGDIRFLAFDVDRTLRDICEAAYPAKLTERVSFGGPTARAAREAIIRDSVAVFPGVFETYCFAAYEASLAGAVVVLNGRNPAFGKGTPWIDGVNCVKFDGTSLRLFEALDRLFDERHGAAPLRPVVADATAEPYWEAISPDPAVAGPLPSLSVVTPHRYEGGLLYGTVDSILSDDDANAQLVVASHGSGEPSADLVLDAFEDLGREAPNRIELIRRQGNFGVGELLLEGIERASGDVVAIIPAGFEVLPGFLERAVKALADNPNHDVVLPTVRVVSEHDVFRTAEHWLPVGGSIHYGLFVNRMTAGCVVARRSLLAEFPPSEVLTAEWLWDVTLRAAFAGRRFIITDEPGVQAIGRVLFDHYAHTEQQRRETFETVRRRLPIKGDGAHVRLSFLGDGELLAGTGPISSALLGQAHAEAARLHEQVEEARRTVAAHSHEGWRDRALIAEDQLRVLSEATTVKFALRTARVVESATPWLKKPLRAALRRK